MLSKGEQIKNVDAASAGNTVLVMETDMEVETCLSVTSFKEDAPLSSMRDARRCSSSSDITILPIILDKKIIAESNNAEILNTTTDFLANNENPGSSEVPDSDTKKQCDAIGISLKQYGRDRRATNKNSDTCSIAQPWCSAQNYSPGDTLSSLMKITDLTSRGNKCTPLTGKEETEGVFSCGSNTNSDLNGIISTKHREIEIEKKNGFIDSSKKSRLDQNKEGDAAEEVEILMYKNVKHAIHEIKDSNDRLALGNEDWPDESGKVSGSTRTSSGEIMAANIPECKAPLSPIRGVISASLSEPNDNTLLTSFKREESSFSFKTEKNLNGELKDNCLETRRDAESNGLSIQIEDDLSSVLCCSGSETINCLVNEVSEAKILIVDEVTTADVSSSDLNNIVGKEPEIVILEAKRNIIAPKRRKLLVLDLNGILADIIVDNHNLYKAKKRVAGKSVFKRLFCDDFLKFCFETFDIGVWSSRRKYNVDNIIDYIMGDNKHKLLFCWDQSRCTYTGFKTLDNVHKPLILKELRKLWDKEESDLPWEKGDYSPSNTLLVDDSPYKALCNPPHTAIFPQPYRFDDENDTSLGPDGDLRVYLENLAQADDVRVYVQEHPFGQPAITSNDSSWNFYHQIIEQTGQGLVQRQ